MLWIRDYTATYAVAHSVTDSIEVPIFPSTINGVPAGPPRRGEVIYGRVVEIDTVSGGEAETLRQQFLEGGSAEALVLFWWIEDCTRAIPVSVSGSDLFGPEAAFFFEANPRPDSLNNMPTFDVLAFRQFYTPSMWTRACCSEPLSPAEYMNWYESLPSMTQWREHAGAAAKQVEDWAKRNSDLASRPPIPTILEHMRDEAAKQGFREIR